MNRTQEPLLALHAISKHFGGLVATNNVSFELWPGEVISIIGPNGAGKTTLINLITGVFPPTRGTIRFNGARIDRLPLDRISHRGIARTFQDLRLFTNLTVLDNVLVATRRKVHASLIEILTRSGRSRAQDHQLRSSATEALVSVGLENKASLYPHNLSAREQRLLALARCLVTEPKLLLLDEPAGGLSREEIRGLSHLLLELRDRGITVVFVEHRMEMIMGLSDRVIVLNFGEVIADDTPDKIQENPAVLAAYLPKVQSTS